MNVTGTVTKISGVQTGEGKKGEWQRQAILIEQGKKYSKLLKIDFWNDAIDSLTDINVGDKVSVTVEASSSEYNGKYYTNVKGFKVSPIEAKTSDDNDDGLPW